MKALRTACAAAVALCALALGALLPSPALRAAPAPAAVTDLLKEQVAEFPGHELTMIKVSYPPGGSSMPHRHDAYVLVYVLEGAIEMQVRGGPLRTVKAGETFVEHPAEVHQVSRNASKDAPATFLVVMLKESVKAATTAVPSP